MGCRVLDLRVFKYRENKGEWVYWCGHTLMSVPLDIVLYHIVKFIKDHPTEVIIIDHRPDWRSKNGDKYDPLCILSNV